MPDLARLGLPTPTKFGRYQVAETPSSLRLLHLHEGTVLREVDHEPKIAVLDQEDLIEQGIIVSSFIPGAPADVDALGSCTANATTAALSNLLSEEAFESLTGCSSFADTKSAEEWAIRFYHACTDQTGDPSQEWPPTDCGSSGPYVVQELETMKLAAGAQVAHGAQNIVSLMQPGGLLTGQPFFNAWMTPDAQGFIDGDGSHEALKAAIASGVAGGHETFMSAVEKLALTQTGRVIPEKTVIRFRNSWTASWGDHGSYRAHLSTYAALGAYCDFRQPVAVSAAA